MATNVAIELTSIASSKVVPLHPHFEGEEQVKNSDQGDVAVRKGRVRKNPLPASDLAKVPTPASDKAKAAVLETIQTAADNLQQGVAQLTNAVKDKLGPDFNPWKTSIMWMFTNFATDQMNQNGRMMVSWETQQEVQTAIMQHAADAEKTNTDSANNAKGASWRGAALFGSIGFVIGVLIGIAVCVATGGAAAAFVVPCLIIGALCGGIAGGGAYFGVQDKAKNGFDNEFLTEKGQLDPTALQSMMSTNNILSQIVTTANNKISSGMQTNVTNVSSQNTTLGQEASAVIQAWAQMNQIPAMR